MAPGSVVQTKSTEGDGEGKGGLSWEFPAETPRVGGCLKGSPKPPGVSIPRTAVGPCRARVPVL